MPLRRKIKEVPEQAQEVEGRPYIDLGKYLGEAPVRREGKYRTEIKIAEIEGFDDIRYVSNTIYDGNILIIDFTAISNDELALRRVVSELKRLAEDVGGDIAGLGNTYIVITPRGIGVDRNKLRRGSFKPTFY